MSQKIEELCQQTIYKLVEMPDVDAQEAALAEFDNICTNPADKKIVAEQLIRTLESEERGSNRVLLLSALSRVNAPNTAETIAKYLDHEQEKSERVRYRAMISIAALDEVEPSDLQKYLDKILDKDPSFRVRAVGLRLLVENGCDSGYLDSLLKMTAPEAMVDERWAALKALRNEGGNCDLPEETEKKIIKVAEQHLADDSEWRDVRYQAALVLGDVTYKRADASWAVSQTLRRNPPKSVLLNCIDALAQLNDRELAKTSEEEKARLNDPDNQREIHEALLFGLQHDDPTVRLRAIEAFKRVMTSYQAVNFIIENLLRQPSNPPDGYFDALRRIDSKTATKTLSDNLLHPDQDVAQRASEALTRLGGAEALRSLQAQRAHMLNKYTELLDNADKQIMRQFDRLMKNARLAFGISMVMHGVTFAVGIALILTSIYLILDPPANGTDSYWVRVLGPGVGGGIVTLLTLFYKDPLRQIGHSVNRLVKVNVVFLGYVRQINQIDATFKQMFLTTTDFGANQMEKTVGQIQESVDQTLERVQAYLTEPGQNDLSSKED